jgi:hypothetical protein
VNVRELLRGQVGDVGAAMHEKGRRQAEHRRRDQAERALGVGQRPGDAREHFLVATDRRQSAARADAGRNQDRGLRIVRRVGGAERPQQLDAVARSDDRQFTRPGKCRQSGKRNDHGQSRPCDLVHRQRPFSLLNRPGAILRAAA